MCLSESMRMDPPVWYSSTLELRETCKIGPYLIHKGMGIIVNYHTIAHDPKQWIEPEKFIPERFDSDSQYFLTPNKERRHPFSFIPFSNGKRSCLGKTFAEISKRTVLSFILLNFDFEFVNKDHYHSKPYYNV